MADFASEKPVPLALLVADHVYHDRETGKWVVAGIFSNIGFTALPRTYDSMEIFFQVTNISKPVDLRLRIEHSEGDTLLDVGGPMQARSPLEVIPRRVVVRQLPFRKPGKYWVMLKSDQEIITQVPLHVSIVTPQQGQPQQGGGDQPQG